MATTDWNRIRELFNRALERGPEERLDFLRKASTHDAWLAEEVNSPTALNRSPGSEVLATPLTFDADIGPYRIIRAVEQQATGTVYLAKRLGDGPETRVVIRMIRPDSLDREFSSNIEQHCRLLAALDHPNLVRVLDGGTTGAGFPYIVTERFSGERFDRYCDRRELSIRRRLGLFIRICSAVDYLHRRSILHRDLRPGNILLDGRGRPRLVGLGIPGPQGFPLAWQADKAALPRGKDRRSARPETAAGEGASTADDLRALGALLYELLCGHRPAGASSTDGDGAGGRAQAHPDPPSTMLTRRVVLEVKQNSLLVTPERVCRDRGGSLQELRSQIRGHLDSVALKALGEDPRKRYASAADLATDIHRHLDGYSESAPHLRLFSRVKSLLPL